MRTCKKHTFNSGFTFALALFLLHRDQFKELRGKEIIKSDFRLYAATDHLYDLEIPENLSDKLKKRIKRFIGKCFKYRLKPLEGWKFTDEIFTECEGLLIAIDKEVFRLKHICCNYH